VIADGYAAASGYSEPSRVLRGTVSFAHRPTLRGLAVVGHTLTARPGARVPRAAVAAYRWYRDDHAIRHARERAYRIRPRDLGHRLSVEVVLAADDWARASRQSPRTRVVR
jgi:hypothetical protein